MTRAGETDRFEIEGWYKGQFFRGIQEYFFMKKLESEDVSLKDDVVYDAFRIPFTHEGVEEWYSPRFYVQSRGIVYDVDANPHESESRRAARLDAALGFFSRMRLQFKLVSGKDLVHTADAPPAETIKDDPRVFLLPRRSRTLEEMFVEQERFMRLLQEERGLTQYPVDLKTKEGQKVVKHIAHECMHELFEAIHLLSDAKDHKKSLSADFDKEKFLEELSDTLHYFVGICILCGIDAEALYGAFMRKSTINFARILGGY